MKSENRKFHQERLKELRKAVELSQENLASMLGVSMSLPSIWESGGSGPSNKNMRKYGQCVEGIQREGIPRESSGAFANRQTRRI